MCYNRGVEDKLLREEGELLTLDKYDFLNVTVRRDKARELVRYYRTFGWEKTSASVRGSYESMLDMSFRRPHKIENKDELQLLQVYLETALNTVGRLERIPRPRTLAFNLIFSLFNAALIIAGLCIALISSSFSCIVAGWILTALGCVLIVPVVYCTVKLYHIEGMAVRARLKAADHEIEEICAEAQRITSGNVGRTENEQ